MAGIDKGVPVPIYYQLKQLIRQRVESGEWRAGQLIPSERELCAEHGISRMTVRQALAELVNEGVLQRQRGKGTYVAPPKIEQPLGALTGFSEEMAAAGKQVESRVLRQELVPASAEVAAALGLPAGEPVVLVERLRLANGEPLALETCYLHFPNYRSVLAEELADQSLYAVLGRSYGVRPSRARQHIEAGIGDARAMRLLGLRRGAAVLLMQRTTFDYSGAPFEHTLSVYRGDKYAFNVELVHDLAREGGSLPNHTDSAK